MIRVAINGYGTVGKRVADAVAAQPDMEIVGVSKTRPSFEAYIAKARGFPLYIADPAKRAPFEKLGLPVAGSVEEMIKRADLVVDATPGGVGEKNKPLYEKAGVKAIFQGGEEHAVAGFSFCSDCNYREAMGRQFVRVVSCNTTGLCRIINTLDKEYGIAKVRAVMVRRASDPGEVKKGPVDAVVLDPVTVPSHHGPDVQTVLPHIPISTMAMIVPTTFMHMHAVQIELKKEGKKERVLELIERHPRMGLVRGGTGIKSTAELKEYALDMGRPRGDLWESCIFADSIAVLGKDVSFFQAIHQEADIVVENVDAIRAMVGSVKDSDESIRMTNEALNFVPI
jgi:glyceraldehyde-3-phosphate dehydrogenase (NAD(P))